ncbi:MAG TPA: TonB family protein [Polyangia bacterium]|nr:TonB family protein [Polyangia bacterium]
MRAQVGVLVMLSWVGCAEENASRPAPRNAVNEEAPQTNQEMTVSAERSDAIERLFARKAQELQSCWQDEYDKNHDRKLEGDVTVQLHISPAGKPGDVKILQSSIKNNGIETCVVQTVSGWSFPDGQTTVPYMRTVHLGAQF